MSNPGSSRTLSPKSYSQDGVYVAKGGPPEKICGEVPQINRMCVGKNIYATKLTSLLKVEAANVE